MSDSLQPHGLQPTRHLHPWDFPGKITGVGCHRLLCHILLTQPIHASSLGVLGLKEYLKLDPHLTKCSLVHADRHVQAQYLDPSSDGEAASVLTVIIAL